MIERSRGDIRDTGLDIAQIGREVRSQMAQLSGRTEAESKNLGAWLHALETDPNDIKNNYKTVFAFLRGRFASDPDWTQKIDAWEERLSGVNA